MGPKRGLLISLHFVIFYEERVIENWVEYDCEGEEEEDGDDDVVVMR